MLTLEDLITHVDGKIFKDSIHEDWQAFCSFMHSFMGSCIVPPSAHVRSPTQWVWMLTPVAKSSPLLWQGWGHFARGYGPSLSSLPTLAPPAQAFLEDQVVSIIKATLSAQEAPDFSLKFPGRLVLDKSRWLIKLG